MKKKIILALFLINLVSNSVKASMLPEVSILKIRNDSIEKKYINDGCKIIRENNGFYYDCKNGSGGYVSLDVACSN